MPSHGKFEWQKLKYDNAHAGRGLKTRKFKYFFVNPKFVQNLSDFLLILLNVINTIHK